MGWRLSRNRLRRQRLRKSQLNAINAINAINEPFILIVFIIANKISWAIFLLGRTQDFNNILILNLNYPVQWGVNCFRLKRIVMMSWCLLLIMSESGTYFLTKRTPTCMFFSSRKEPELNQATLEKESKL